MINEVRLMGYFGADAQTDNLSNGSKKVRFPLSLYRRGQKSGNFIQCEAWNGTADIVLQHGKKGVRAIVEAELRVDVWKTPEGETRSKTYVNVNRIIFPDVRISQNPENGGNTYNNQTSNRPSNGGNAGNSGNNVRPQNSSTPAPAPAASKPNPSSESEDVDLDNIFDGIDF